MHYHLSKSQIRSSVQKLNCLTHRKTPILPLTNVFLCHCGGSNKVNLVKLDHQKPWDPSVMWHFLSLITGQPCIQHKQCNMNLMIYSVYHVGLPELSPIIISFWVFRCSSIASAATTANADTSVCQSSSST